jgi:hypothetical protein
MQMVYYDWFCCNYTLDMEYFYWLMVVIQQLIARHEKTRLIVLTKLSMVQAAFICQCTMHNCPNQT